MSYEEFEYDPDDCFESGPDYDVWKCVKCSKEFVDPEDFPSIFVTGTEDPDIKIELKLYWLGINEPLCMHCAAKAGIPPIDEGDE